MFGLNRARIELCPRLPHFPGKFWMVGFKFARGIGEHDNNRIDTGGNRRKQDTAYGQADNESNKEGNSNC